MSQEVSDEIARLADVLTNDDVFLMHKLSYLHPLKIGIIKTDGRPYGVEIYPESMEFACIDIYCTSKNANEYVVIFYTDAAAMYPQIEDKFINNDVQQHIGGHKYELRFNDSRKLLEFIRECFIC